MTLRLPPVTDDTWDDAIKRCLADNKKRGEGPTSMRQLALALPGRDAKRSLNRIRSKNAATEDRARELSEALRVPREALPAASHRLTLHDLEDRLEGVEDALNALQADRLEWAQNIFDRLDALERESRARRTREGQ